MKNRIWQKLGAVAVVFLGGMLVVLSSFASLGFPFAIDPIQNLVWIEVMFLAALLGIPPLFR